MILIFPNFKAILSLYILEVKYLIASSISLGANGVLDDNPVPSISKEITWYASDNLLNILTNIKLLPANPWSNKSGGF